MPMLIAGLHALLQIVRGWGAVDERIVLRGSLNRSTCFERKVSPQMVCLDGRQTRTLIVVFGFYKALQIVPPPGAAGS